MLQPLALIFSLCPSSNYLDHSWKGENDMRYHYYAYLCHRHLLLLYFGWTSVMKKCPYCSRDALRGAIPTAQASRAMLRGALHSYPQIPRQAGSIMCSSFLSNHFCGPSMWFLRCYVQPCRAFMPSISLPPCYHCVKDACLMRWYGNMCIHSVTLLERFTGTF